MHNFWAHDTCSCMRGALGFVSEGCPWTLKGEAVYTTTTSSSTLRVAELRSAPQAQKGMLEDVTHVEYIVKSVPLALRVPALQLLLTPLSYLHGSGAGGRS